MAPLLCAGSAALLLALAVAQSCEIGNFLPAQFVGVPGQSCRPCIPGFYCPGLLHGETPIACPAGTYYEEYGAQELSQCKNCTAGRYQDHGGRSVCFNCPSGTYSNTTGLSSVGNCSICPCGHFCQVGSVAPAQCPTGTWLPTEGNTVWENCRQCPLNTYCPRGTCAWSGCTTCPPGKFMTGNVSGTGWMGGSENCSQFCQDCPADSYCGEGTRKPVACPPGTFSVMGEAFEQPDCIDCPVGFRCQQRPDPALEFSSVAREPNGEFVVQGSEEPEVCEVDNTIVHWSYPDFKGCTEHCPYQLPRQSYCHTAGDGRFPDRGRQALLLGELVVQRTHSTSLFNLSVQEAALANLSFEVANMTEAELHRAMTEVDPNGRTLLHLAAMNGDVPVLEILSPYGNYSIRDAEGFTPLVHALRLGHDAAVEWMVSAANAELAPVDVPLLEGLGVNTSGLPVAPFEPAPEYLGRGGMGWWHPSGEDFNESPFVGRPRNGNTYLGDDE